MLLPKVSKFTMSLMAFCFLTCPKTDIPIIAYIKVIKPSSAPILKSAGKDTIKANNSFRIPLAA